MIEIQLCVESLFASELVIVVYVAVTAVVVVVVVGDDVIGDLQMENYY